MTMQNENITTAPATLPEFIERYGITLRLKPTYDNPHADLGAGAHHYRATLRYGRRTLTTPFSTGAAWKDEPNAADVLSCLLSDASVLDHHTFESWAGDYGYDIDSRKAERIYRACLRSAKQLQHLLGDELLEYARFELEGY